MRGVRVEPARDFGEAFLGLALWRRLGLHSLPAELIEPGEEEVPWPTVASVLTVARFCGQRSELGIAERCRGPERSRRGMRTARWRICSASRGRR